MNLEMKWNHTHKWCHVFGDFMSKLSINYLFYKTSWKWFVTNAQKVDNVLFKLHDKSCTVCSLRSSVQTSPGPSSCKATLESVPHPVWKHHHTVRCSEVCLVHSVLHHRGPGLLQHRWPHRTLEWQKLQRHWQHHLKTRESLCLMPLNVAVYI